MSEILDYDQQVVAKPTKSNKAPTKEPDYSQVTTSLALLKAKRDAEELHLVRERVLCQELAMKTFCSPEVLAKITSSLAKYEEASKVRKRIEMEPSLQVEEEEPEPDKKKKQKTGIIKPFNVLTSMLSFKNSALEKEERKPQTEVLREAGVVQKSLSKEKQELLVAMAKEATDRGSKFTKEEIFDRYPLIFPPEQPAAEEQVAQEPNVDESNDDESAKESHDQ